MHDSKVSRSVFFFDEGEMHYAYIPFKPETIKGTHSQVGGMPKQ